MNRLLALILFILLLTDLHAQNRWNKGYIVTNNGDTLTGKIDNIGNTLYPKTIAFKNDVDQVIKQYSPGEIESFCITTAYQPLYFKSFATDAEVSPENLAFLSNVSKPITQHCAFFAQLLAAGNNKLYAFKDPVIGKKHFLIEYAGGNISELIFKRYFIDNDKTQIGRNEAYKQQLQQLYAHCSKFNFSDISNAQYTTTGMLRLARKYNRCDAIDTGLRYEFKRERSTVDFGLVVGTENTKLTLNGSYLSRAVFNPATTANAGVNMHLTFPNCKGRISFYSELLFTKYDMNTSFGAYVTNTPLAVGIDVTYLKLLTAIRYQLPIAKFTPFLQAGITNGYALSFTATPSIYEYYTPQNYEMSYFASIGLKYDRCELEYRNENSNGFTGGFGGSVFYSQSILFKYYLIQHN